MKEAVINSSEEEGEKGRGGWSKIKYFIKEAATHIKADARDRVGRQRARERE